MDRKKMGRPPLPLDRKKRISFALRAAPAWDEWVRELARSRGQTVADLAQDAIEAHARSLGFRMPPER